jgi:hypothetical protein
LVVAKEEGRRHEKKKKKSGEIRAQRTRCSLGRPVVLLLLQQLRQGLDVLLPRQKHQNISRQRLRLVDLFVRIFT